MKTIVIKENSKQAKAIIEMLKTFDFVEFIDGLGRPAVKKEIITPKQRTLINRLKRIKKDVDNGNMKKFRPISELLDEI